MVIHLLKLIRSRLGGSCWILVELLVVFVILWFMMYYFVAQGMLTRMPVGFKLDHVYNVTLAIRPSDSPSFIAYEEGSEEPVRNIERIVERTMSVSGVRNSWEMLVKKRSFDWFRASTSRMCFCSYFSDSRNLILDL